MSDQEGLSRRNITFAQAEGTEPLPRQLKLRELSQEVRAKLWLVLFKSMEGSIGDSGASYGYDPVFKEPWRGILFNFHVLKLHRFADDFRNDPEALVAQAKDIVATQPYDKVLTFVEFVVREPQCPHRLDEQLNLALTSSRAAYRILDKSVVPVASEDEASAIERAFATIEISRFSGARLHLSAAGRELSSGNFSASVRESIHAVESAARILNPSSNSLGPALTALERSGSLHGSLKAGFGSLYGFTSDEEGIRHALLEKDRAAVDEADALYMFGACAAFITYLSLKTSAAA